MKNLQKLNKINIYTSPYPAGMFVSWPGDKLSANKIRRNRSSKAYVSWPDNDYSFQLCRTERWNSFNEIKRLKIA